MTAHKINGSAVAAALKGELAVRVAALAARGVRPGLGTVLVGDDPGSRSYVAGKHRDCAEIGIGSWIVEFLQKVHGLDVVAGSLYLSLYFGLITLGRLLDLVIVGWDVFECLEHNYPDDLEGQLGFFWGESRLYPEFDEALRERVTEYFRAHHEAEEDEENAEGEE
mgnify:CR=1 FL=1